MDWQKVQGFVSQAGSVLKDLTANPNLQPALDRLQLAPLLKMIDEVPLLQLSKRVEGYTQRYKNLSLPEQAHRLILDRTLDTAGSGLIGNFLPGMIGSLFSLSPERVFTKQVELACEIALLHGRMPADNILHNEVATILTSVMAGRALVEIGASVIGEIPLAGSLVRASSTAALTYAIGQMALQYYQAIAGGSSTVEAMESASAEAQRYLQNALTQEQRMDQILLHLALADIPVNNQSLLLERLSPIVQDPSNLEQLVKSASKLPKLEDLLKDLDEEFGIVLLNQAERLIQSDGHVSEREATMIAAISQTLRQRVHVDAGDFGNRILTQNFKATVRGVAFSPDGQWLVAVSDDGYLRGWCSYDKGIQFHERYAIKAHDKEIRTLALADSVLYTAGEDKTIAVWDYRQGIVQRRIKTGYSSGIFALAAHGETELATGSYNGEITLWNPKTGAARRSLPGHGKSVWALLFHSDGKRLISAGNDKRVRVWDSGAGTCLRELEAHPEGVYSLAIHPDGKTLATGCWDQQIRLWDLESGELLKTLTGHKAAVWQLQFSQDGTYLYSGADDQRILIWDLALGSIRLNLEGHRNGIYALAVSPVQPLLASGSWDQSVRLWSLELD